MSFEKLLGAFDSRNLREVKSLIAFGDLTLVPNCHQTGLLNPLFNFVLKLRAYYLALNLGSQTVLLRLGHLIL